MKKTIQLLILIATLITFLPLTGFGVYFDEDEQKCLRYRDATSILDISYAYLFMIFGKIIY